MRSRSTMVIAWLVVAAVIAVAVVMLTSNDPDESFSLTSYRSEGARLMAEMLDEFGHPVRERRLSDLGDVGTVVIAWPEELSKRQSDQLREFAETGGTVLLNGPSADLGAVGSGTDLVDLDTPGRCDLPVLSEMDLGPMYPPNSLAAFTSPIALETQESTLRCYGDADSAAFAGQRVGSGIIVTAWSGGFIANSTMRAHEEGTDLHPSTLSDAISVMVGIASISDNPRVVVVRDLTEPGKAGSGERTLWSFVRPSVRAGLWQGVLAFALLVFVLSRRFERDAPEALPVEISGAEFVAAVGDMMRRRNDPGAAAEVIRRDALRVLRRRLALTPDATDDMVLEALARTTSANPDALQRAFVVRVTTNDGLVESAKLIDRLLEENPRDIEYA